MCDLTRMPAAAPPTQRRPLASNSDIADEGPRASPERDDVLFEAQQPNPSPVFDKHADSPERTEAVTTHADGSLAQVAATVSAPRAADEMPTASQSSCDAVHGRDAGAHAERAPPAGDQAAAAPAAERDAAVTGAPKRPAAALEASEPRTAQATGGDLGAHGGEGVGREVAAADGSGPTAGKKPRHGDGAAKHLQAGRAQPKSGDQQLLSTSLLARHIPAANSAAQVRQWFSQFGEVTAVMLICGQGNEDEVQALITFVSQDQCDQARSRCLEAIAALRHRNKQSPSPRKSGPPPAATAAADVDMAGMIRQAVTHMHECGIDTHLWPMRRIVPPPRASMASSGHSTDSGQEYYDDRKRKHSSDNKGVKVDLKSDPWTEQETARLLEAAHRNRRSNWPKIARYVGARSEDACRHRFSTVLRHDPQRVEAAALMMGSYVDSSEDDDEDGASTTSHKRVKLVVGSKPSRKSRGSGGVSPTEDISLPWSPKEDAELAKIVRARAGQAPQAAVANDWAEIAVHLNAAVRTGAHHLLHSFHLTQ